MRKLIAFLFCVLAMQTYAANVFAADYALVCDSCTELAARVAAMNEAIASDNEGDYYVFDYDNEDIYAYSIELDYQPPMPTLATIVGYPTISSNLLSDFSKAVSQLETFEAPLGAILIDVADYPHVYTAIGDSNAYTFFTQEFRDEFGPGLYTVAWFAGAALTLTQKLANLDVVMAVYFDDGSHIKFSARNFRIVDRQLKFDIVFKSAADDQGNVVHEDTSNYDDDTVAAPGDSPVWNYLEDHNIDVYFFNVFDLPIPGPSTSRCYETDCAFDQQGVLKCTAKEVSCSGGS